MADDDYYEFFIPITCLDDVKILSDWCMERWGPLYKIGIGTRWEITYATNDPSIYDVNVSVRKGSFTIDLTEFKLRFL